MDAKVVDASALAAFIFDEPEANEIAGRIDGATLVAPALLAFEIANVWLKKLRRYPERRAALLGTFSLYVALAVEIREIDHAGALVVAEQFGLTSYDASYLWLARRLGAELVTLDRRLARAAAVIGRD